VREGSEVKGRWGRKWKEEDEEKQCERMKVK
jgi:hypothetical protein